jgi:hypothetical protein
MYNLDLLAADVILILHFAIVAFVVGGAVMVWAGYLAHWAWVRNARFRVVHLLTMLFVLVESLVGVLCPLTEWEHRLRVRGGTAVGPAESFIKTWLHKIMYYDLSAGTFILLYLGFFALIVLALIVVPPDWRAKSRRRRPQA